MSKKPVIGFLGLGAIGQPISRNISLGGFRVLGFDVADRALWAGAVNQPAASCAEVAASSDIILLSLPDAKVVRAVIADIIATPACRARAIVDLSTIGVTAAREFTQAAAAAGIAYVDAPVSGGTQGAEARNLSVMCACAPETFASVEPVLQAFAKRVFHVGPVPGQGQALKLANNFLSATALIATSEAAIFGIRNGLTLDKMMEVLAVSSGRNSAVDDKFPKHVNLNRFDSGFRNTLMSKDVGLFASEAAAANCLGKAGDLVNETWRAFAASLPDQDTTAMFRYVGEGFEDARNAD